MASLSDMEYLEASKLLLQVEQQYDLACFEVKCFNRKLDELERRYEHASRAGHSNHGYSLRIQLSVLSGVRDMYVVYAIKKHTLITKLQEAIFESELESGSDSDAFDLMDTSE